MRDYVMVPRGLLERAETSLHWAYHGGEYAAEMPDEISFGAAKEQVEGLEIRDELRVFLAAAQSDAGETPEDETEVEERLSKATPGPWVAEAAAAVRLDPPSPAEYDGSLAVTSQHCVSEYGLIPHGVVFKDDAVFIAHARTDLIVLLARLRAVRAELRGLQTAVRQHRDEKGHDRCWLDDQKLYAALPEGQPGDLTLPPKEEFLRGCERYYELRRTKSPDEADDDARRLAKEGTLGAAPALKFVNCACLRVSPFGAHWPGCPAYDPEKDPP